MYSLGLIAALASPGCIVKFQDWPDAAGSTGGRTSTGGRSVLATGGRDTGVNGGSAGEGATAGGTATGGAATGGVATGGVATGGVATGGAATGGAATGGVGKGGASSTATGGRTVWLSLTADRARGSDPPNDSLAVDGVFRAKSDSCAIVNFNPNTRCVSGSLCNVGPSYENWGVAIEFAFRVTSSTGSPPNATLLWDPRAVGATGIAWSVSGSGTTGLQLWVLNMDPKWQGSCTADTCEISGPPDGARNISLNGTLNFDAMVKDDWGGSGTPYTYNPALTHSLQFKIPTVVVGAISFDYCIDRLGVVLK